MKVVILHPPLYPMNHKFFNELGKHIDLVVYSFGNYPGYHATWKVKDYISPSNNYSLKVLEGNTDLKRLAVSYKLQLNPSFLKYLHKEYPQIVISVAFWVPSLYVAVFKHFYKCKLLILTDAISVTESQISTFKKLLRFFISRRADAFVSGSDLTTQYLQTITKGKAIFKSTQTIDSVSWSKDLKTLESKSHLRKALGLPMSKKIVLTVGHLIPLKNNDKIIDSIKDLDNVHLVIVGEGYLRETLEEKIKIEQLEQRVTLLKRKEGTALKAYFKASDIFVFASARDTFGYVVLEALASGLPVVCSKFSGASSLIDDGYNGFVINPEQSFTKEILAAIEQLETLANNALQSSENFTIERKVEGFVEILKQVVND
ncbi:MAG: glycosyltransferase [Flavobacteriaceae bacterium]|nr:glycosyltransferase [Flavobacteriaceae bacterium]